MPLSAGQKCRYARQLVMPEFAEHVHEKLFNASVCIKGNGLSMELCTLYLAGAGVGRIVLAGSEAGMKRIAMLVNGLNPDTVVVISESGQEKYPVEILFPDTGRGDRDETGAERIACEAEDGDAWKVKVGGGSGRYETGTAGAAVAALALGLMAGYSGGLDGALLIDPEMGEYTTADSAI